MEEVCEDWGVDVDRGPDWLFVRLRPGTQEPADMADKLWNLADRHFVYRLVLEMDQLNVLPSRLMGAMPCAPPGRLRPIRIARPGCES